ncbi:MAG: ABC transporter substrate-binding protein [Blautia sp.]|nr:ABC transporter substrate-binding protein [Blautia sp.]
MKEKKKLVGILAAGILSAGLAVSVFASEAPVRVGAMSGPTAMGMVKLMDEAEAGETQNVYEFADLATDASAFAAPLTKGELDIAALPSNLASVLYNNTEGKVQVLAVNVLSVLNIVEKGEEISSLADLAGKKLYATGQGATPEAVLRYLLTENGVDPDKDLEIHWCADTTEALAYITEDEAAIAMLPQPFVTVAMTKAEGLKTALNLGEEWEKLDNGCQVVTGVLAVRKEFAEEHPEELKTFVQEYRDSAAYAMEDIQGTAALIEKYGILPKAALAEKALPNCGVTCLMGEEMKETLSGYLEILNGSNPQMIGGSLPGEDFYLFVEE